MPIIPRRNRPQSVSREALSTLGRQLAQTHVQAVSIRRKSRLYQDLNHNCHTLEENYRSLAQASKRKEALTPGVEWFLDNYHIVEKHIIDIRRHFPKGYDRTLLKIVGGENDGYPRVYVITRELFLNSDAVLDVTLLNSFLHGYQEISALNIGEVWAIPIMIRFALLHHLVELTNNMLGSMRERVLVERLIDEIIGDEQRPGTDILLTLAAKVVERPDFLINGAPNLIRRLRDRGPRASLTLHWIEERIREQGREPEEIIREEQHWLASDQISIANTFTSLRGLSYMSWQEWVEGQSHLEQALLKDPLSIYSASDFATRDRARQVIEKIARKSSYTETQIAEEALTLLRNDEHKSAKHSLLYYILGDGRADLERKVLFTPAFRGQIGEWCLKNSFALYSLAILFISFGLLLRLSLWISSLGAAPWMLVLLVVIASVLAIDVATNVVQWIISYFTSPSLLPKFDYERGIPDDAKTVVVVQTLVGDREAVERSIEGLHVRCLANDDENLIFGLLADLADAPSEIMPDDERIMEHARNLVAELNQEENKRRYFVLFRKRLWNPSEQKWMAWERKRGKLEEFNHLILGNEETTFVNIEPEVKSALRECRYVITLDNDSQLPRGTAVKLVGAMAHPLNRPVICEKTGVVTSGFGIIQPRMGISLTSAFASRFSRVFSGHSGLDPYTQTVSDVYQDFFGEASYIGKGIYDVKAFEASLRNRVPDNALLSHDLFESLFARCALASDIELFDDFPSKYLVHARRQHRWTRGDWQLLPWIPFVIPNSNWKYGRTPISNLGRWKLFDNLRRSLVAPALFLFLILGWGLFPGSPIQWLWMALFVVAFPVVTNLAQAFLIPPRNIAIASHVRGVGRDLFNMGRQMVISFALLPHQAWVMITAIITTLYRRGISGKNLLEWETAASAERRMGNDWSAILRDMGLPLAIAGLAIVLVGVVHPLAIPVAAPVLALWLSSPWIVLFLSSPVVEKNQGIDLEDREYLTGIAFDTWKYFRDHLEPKYNYLIPDNLQIVPTSVVAERTSPTNISLSLLSIISSYDFGFLPLPSMVTLLDTVVRSLSSLEQYHGHFINWYATDDKRALAPRYVSFVDSGNLIGHFVALRSAVSELREAALLHEGHRVHLLKLLRTEQQTTVIENARRVIGEPNVMLTDLCQVLDEVHNAAPGSKLARDIKEFRELRLVLATDDRAAFGAKRDLLRKDAQEKLESSWDYLESWFDRSVKETDCSFLYDEEKGLFVIGYNVESGRKDGSFYDLLASESRLGSFMAVALGQVPQKHWFSLGRALTESLGGKALLSWSGTMFEYLMPLVVMKDFPGTLLSETYRSVVKAQQAYAAKLDVPWGISESAYSGVDFEKTFQYRAFGVPGLGMKRGLEDDLIISPYSTFLALMVAPHESIANLRRLEAEGLRGEYGFFESVDYTQNRLAESETAFLVKAFFAHHQGMSLIALNNVVNHDVMQERFHRDPLVKSSELLLHERFPDKLPTIGAEEPVYSPVKSKDKEEEDSVVLALSTPHTVLPRTHLVSNGNLTSMVDNSGSGFLLFEKELMLTRWREDPTTNRWGTFIFIRDLDSGKVWGAGFQPLANEPDMFEVVFAPDKIELKRKDTEIFSQLDITVSPEDNVEIRRLTLSNTGRTRRRLEVTSYGEVCLASLKADAAHPAFNKMFISSEFVADLDTLIFTRRARSVHESPIFLFHQVSMKQVFAKTQFETAKPNFIGRNKTLRNPEAIFSDEKLSGSEGVVLDPIFSLRVKVEVDVGETESVTFVTGVSRERHVALEMATKYRDVYQVHRAFEMAWSQSSVELRNERISARQAQLFQRLANCLIFNYEKVRALPEVLTRNRLTQPALWRFGISGDVPVCLARVTENPDLKLVEELLRAHYYLRTKGFQFDLVILNEFPAGYFQSLQEEIDALVRSSLSAGLVDKKGGVFLRTSQQISEGERDLLQTVARVVLAGARGGLMSQLKLEDNPTEWVVIKQYKDTPETEVPLELEEGAFATKYGRFIRGGDAFALEVKGSDGPPLPWSNVIANSEFGILVTESGGGYTWSENSRENRLTPWGNDPVSDIGGEAIFIRDTATGHYWSPTPAPVRKSDTVSVIHGLGFSEFHRKREKIRSVLTVTVSPDDRVRWWGLELINESNEERDLEVFLYVEWVLGVLREDNYRFIQVGFEEISQSLWAVNHYNNEFAGRYAFISASEPIVTFGASRREFIGRNRGLSAPIALERAMSERGVGKSSIRLSSRGALGVDPCGVIKINVHLNPKEKKDVSFFMGEVPEQGQIKAKVAKYTAPGAFESALAASKKHFEMTCQPVKVKTPDKAFDILMNGWLLYQTLSCRIQGRSAFYQSGGAFGFRDQLQDTLAFLPFEPEMIRKQLHLNASRQFIEGDVQHWWHPPTGRGTRTRFSDDFLWMPYALLRYIDVTGKKDILDDVVSFIGGQQLQAHEHEVYTVPFGIVGEGTMYEHCVKAIEHGLAFGAHGLPLMGCGDWNDGMNEVGREGKGESVWLGWFMQPILTGFAEIAQSRGDAAVATRFLKAADSLRKAVDENAWDGAWYRRAFFDDGTPLGSSQNDECQIDSLAQSWSVIVGTGDPKRSKQAMESAYSRLVDRKNRIIRLLTPPFNKTELNPGYIKGYLPGTRENGAQYTHAATWLVIAAAMSGDGDKAVELWSMLNPITHTMNEQGVEKYQGEPYVLCGDVYSVDPHAGRAGWSWYTGSSGWLFQAGLHHILGVKFTKDGLRINPCISKDWPECSAIVRHEGNVYQIQIANPNRVNQGVRSLEINGKEMTDKHFVPFQNGNVVVKVTLG